MSAWVTVPCLLALRDEFNKVSPHRDKGADGTIGDSAHTSSSDHTPDEDSDVLHSRDSDHVNEVHALDIDSSGPWPGGSAWFDRTVKQLVAEEKRRWLDPDDMCRLDYIIHNRVIYSRSRNFAPKAYTGSDPHTNHAHFSARYETRAENDTRSWGVYKPPATTPIKQGETVDAKDAKLFVDTLLDTVVPFPYDAARPTRTLRDVIRYTPSANTVADYVDRKLDARFAALLGAVGGVDEEVLNSLAGADRSPEEVASALRAVLGDRADEVFRAGLGESSGS
jgi:hypothetical protein